MGNARRPQLLFEHVVVVAVGGLAAILCLRFGACEVAARFSGRLSMDRRRINEGAQQHGCQCGCHEAALGASSIATHFRFSIVPATLLRPNF